MIGGSNTMFRFFTIQLYSLLTSFLFSLCIVPFSSLARAQTAPQRGSLPTGTTAKLPTISARMPADLSKDARLDRRLSLHEVGTSLNVLLKKISSPDLILTVETESAEQKLHINIKQRSVRQLMQSLADVFSGSWYVRQDGTGYRYETNLQTIRRRRHWWDLFLGEREKAFNAMRASVLQTMRTSLKPPVRFVKNHTEEDGIDEETWRKLASEKNFFSMLPATLQDQVANNIDEVPWYNMRGLVTSSGMDEGALFVPLRSLPDEIRSKFMPATTQAQADPSEERDTFVRFSNFGNLVMGALVTLDGHTVPRMLASMNVPSSMEMLPLRLNQAKLPEEVKKRGKAASAAWKELAAYQQSCVWINDVPKQYPTREMTNRIDVQEYLAETQGIEFVSDYYTAFRGVMSSKPEKLRLPLTEELNWQAQAQDISWKREAGSDIYLFRNNRWYRDDLLEIPAPSIQRLLAYKKRQVEQELQWRKEGRVPTPQMGYAAFRLELDCIAEAVHTLTPWQLFNGLANVVVPADQIPLSPTDLLVAQQNAANTHKPPRLAFEQDMLGILFQYHTLHFYGSLSKEERAVLLEGHLDFHALSPEHQQQARYLLPLLQVFNPTLIGEQLLIGIQPDPGGYIGVPHMRLFISSKSSDSAH